MESFEIDQSKSISLSQNLSGLIVEVRPRDWVKNLLVFSGVIFSGSLTDLNNLKTSFLGFVLFCCASSCIYVFNDLCDLREDREHPDKLKRPLAAGVLNVNLARLSAIVLFAIAILGAWALNRSFAVVVFVYLAVCLFYSLKLKDIVILDVILIASGFVLRAISGAVLIGVEASEWLVLCTSMVALLIGFGKRRHELVLLSEIAGNHRRSLNEYSLEFLNSIMNICGGAAVITYAIYTCSDETVKRIGSRGMLLTVPFVIYGVFRYLFLVQKGIEGGNPVQLLFRDRSSAVNLLLWIIASGMVIYLRRLWPS